MDSPLSRKSPPRGRGRGPLATRLHRLLFGAGFFGSVVLSAPASPLPSGGAVIAGEARIAAEGNAMTIEQGSDKAILEWGDFSIGSGASVDFRQPGSESVALNRVVGGNPSAIHGSLSANGKLFLVNPSGILFGAGASVNVGGLVASTLGISDSDFLSGNYRFSGSGGSVVNRGNINAAVVALLGRSVTNEGVIGAQAGSVALATGEQMTLTFADGLTVTVDGEELDALEEEGEAVQGENGAVAVTESAARSLESRAVAESEPEADGLVASEDGSFQLVAGAGTNASADAASATGEPATPAHQVLAGGTVEAERILVEAGPQGEATVTGTLDASAQEGEGGRVTVLGERVELAETARLDASGPAGGGSIRVGGGLRGEEESVRNAEETIVQSGAELEASATAAGDGGEVIVWADGYTGFGGAIFARGGPLRGEGGFAEVSGKQVLDFRGTADLTAPLGETGTLLLDPHNLRISNDKEENIGFVGTPTDETFPLDSPSNLPIAILENALASSNVLVTTTRPLGTKEGDITVEDPVEWTKANSLTLEAADDIFVNADLRADKGDLTLTADADNSITGGETGQVSLGNNAQVVLDGASSALTVSAYGDISDGTGAGEGSFQASGTSDFTSSDGSVLLDSSDNQLGDKVSASSGSSGSIFLTANDAIELGEIAAGSGGVTVESNSISLTDDISTEGGEVELTADAATAADTTLVLEESVTVDTTDGGLVPAGGNLTLRGTIDGAADNVQSLSLNAGTGGEILVTDAIGGGTDRQLATLTVVNSNGATFEGTVTAATVALTDTTGTVFFEGDTTITSALTTAAEDYGLRFTGASNRIAGDTTLRNTGTVTLGEGNRDTITFAGGLTATAPSSLNLAGTVATTDQPLALGSATGSTTAGPVPVLLTADTSLAAGTADLTLTGTLDGAFALDLASTGATTLAAEVGSNTKLASLTTNAGGSTVFEGTSLSVEGALTFGDEVTTAKESQFTTAGGTVRFASDLALGGDLGIDTTNSGAAAAGADLTFEGTIATGGGAPDPFDLTFTAGTGGRVDAKGKVDAQAVTVVSAGGATFDASGNTLDSIAATVGTGGLTVRNRPNLTVASGGITSEGAVDVRTSAGNLTLEGTIGGPDSGDVLLAADENFINNEGSAVFDLPADARWLVYSTDPEDDTRGGLETIADFKQYDAGLSDPVRGGADQNGLLYDGVAPQITPSLIGTVEKVYDATTAANNIQPTNYDSTTGVIDGDTVELNDPASGTYNDKNVGTGKTVTVSGVDITQATANRGSTTVFGYTLTTDQAEGRVGVITTRPLTVTADDQEKVYGESVSLDDTAFTVAAGTADTGLVGGEGVSSVNLASAATAATSDAGDYPIEADAVTAGSGGFAASNYAITFDDGTFTVNPRPVTVEIVGTPTKTYDGTDAATLADSNYRLSNLVAGQDFEVTQTTGRYNSPNVTTANTVTAALEAGDFTGLAGADPDNYAFATTASGPGVIDSRLLTVKIVGNPTKDFDGSTAANLAPSNFSVGNTVAGQGFTITQSTGSYASPGPGTGIEVTAGLGAADFAGTNTSSLLSNYRFPGSARGTGTIVPVPPTPPEPTPNPPAPPEPTPNPPAPPALSAPVPGPLEVLGPCDSRSLAEPDGNFIRNGEVAGNFFRTEEVADVEITSGQPVAIELDSDSFLHSNPEQELRFQVQTLREDGELVEGTPEWLQFRAPSEVGDGGSFRGVAPRVESEESFELLVTATDCANNAALERIPVVLFPL